MKEVSCRLFSHWFSTIERAGGSVERACAGLPYTREYLANRANRVDWDEYVTFCETTVKELGGIDKVPDATILFGNSDELIYLRRLVGWVASPYRLYDYIVCKHGRYLYTHLDFKLRKLPDGKLELRIRIPDGYTHSPEWFWGSVPTFETLTGLIGLPPAKITTEVHERLGIYLIDPPESATLLHRLKRLGSALLTPLGFFQFADAQQAELVKLIEELEHERDSLNHLISNLPSGILIVRGGRIAFANANLRQMYGLREDQAMAPADLAPLDLATTAAGFRFTPSGQDRLVELANRSPLTYQGHPAELLVLRDITATQRVEDRIAEAATREREKLAQDLHDGLGQYFAALNFKTSLLMSNEPEGSLRHVALGEIATLVREAGSLSREVVYGMNPSYADAGNLIASLRKLCARMERLFPVAFSFRSSLPAARTSAAVAGELFFLTREAMTNAARHAGPESITLQVSEETEGWLIRIIDDGCGFDVPSIQQEGSGLGLEAMRLRAARLGGTLEICSSPEGSEIRLHLPAGLLLPMEPHPAPSATSASGATASHRIFLMDDHAIVREGVRRLIEADGSMIICGEADGPENLVDALTRTQADTLISDWLIGEDSSAPALVEARRRLPGLRIIVLTMLEGETYRQQALAAGADAFIHKGQAPDHLLTILRSTPPLPG